MHKFFSFTLFMLFLTYLNAQKFETYGNDTINYVDADGKKQGLWIYFYDPEKTKIQQRGKFIDNMKNGVWEIFYPDGKLQSRVTYKNNIVYGNVQNYYPNGKLQEEGFWKINKWVGEYKYYYENGQLKYHWFFDDNGQRTGKQLYYYENGKKQIEGEWLQGKEQGKIVEYHPNGNVSKVVDFENGKINGEYKEFFEDGAIKLKIVYINGEPDPQNSIVYSRNKPKQQVDTDIELVKSDTTKPKEKELEYFTGNGFYKVINERGMVEQEGFFQKGILINGKKYTYDKDGKLVRTVVIEDGRIVEVINEKK